MMRVAKLYQKGGKKPVISFEFFRAKTEKAAKSFEAALDLLGETRHDYISVIFLPRFSRECVGR